MKELPIQFDGTLLDVVVNCTRKGFQMTGIDPVPVGVSRLVSQRHTITVMVGLVGKASGNIALNVSEPALFHLASALLGESHTELNDDNIDALMELGNMVAGCAKELLLGTEHEVEEISLPSIIWGEGVSVMYARGIHTVSAEFELPAMPVSMSVKRFFSVGISLLRRAGGRR